MKHDFVKVTEHYGYLPMTGWSGVTWYYIYTVPFSMEINVEYELNRAWIMDEDGEPIGETNFVVPEEWLQKLYDENFADEYDSLDELVEVYEPEDVGEFIYQQAIKDGVLIEDLGVVMYEEEV